MLFKEKFENIVSKIDTYQPKRAWVFAIIFSVFIFFAASLYLFIWRRPYNLASANKALADSSVILIGVSFALSGLCYFWDFVDTKIIYRKHLGVIGFLFAFLHIIISVFFLPQNFTFPKWIFENKIAFDFGVLAFIIFLLMALISNRYSVMKLGGKKWRLVLRYSGFIAFLAVAAHIFALKYKYWLKWLADWKSSLPSLSMIVFVIIIAIFILRFSLFVAEKKKFKKQNIK